MRGCFVQTVHLGPGFLAVYKDGHAGVSVKRFHCIPHYTVCQCSISIIVGQSLTTGRETGRPRGGQGCESLYSMNGHVIVTM